jgi:hypothetical protein
MGIVGVTRDISERKRIEKDRKKLNDPRQSRGSFNFRVKMAQDLGAGAYVRKPYVFEKIGLAVRVELDRMR